MHFNIALASTFVVNASAFIIGTERAPLIGPSFATNFDHFTSKPLEDAKTEFSSRLEQLFSTEKLNRTDLVFAVDVFSANTNSSIYSKFHVGEGQEKILTAGELNSDTIGRLGSVSKLVTAYGLIAEAGIEVFSHPVTRYFPELRSNSTVPNRIKWEEITVGALASHQAGTGGVGDYFRKVQSGTEMTVDSYVAFLRDEKRPTMAAYRNALYSDAGYSLLGHVLGRITGQSYPEAIQKVLFDRLGLNSSTAFPPAPGPDVNAMNRTLVANTSSFNIDSPITASSGGVFGSISDLRKIGLSILNSEVLSSATTRAWMKPLSATGSLVDLVGAPWEINRLTIPATPGSNYTRVSDLYTKAGGNGDYTCILALSPDHGIGYTFLIAGSTASSARWPLRQTLGEVFIPAAERAAAENADKNYTGTFVDTSSGNTTTNMTITFDKNEPGLGLKSFYFQGTESSYLLVGATKPIAGSYRMYPTGPSETSQSLAELYRSEGTIRVSQRIVYYASPLEPRAAALGGEGLFENQFEWYNIGFQGATDELVFEITDGKLVSVTVVGAELLTGKPLVLNRL
uniref:Beta-lactamase-related domain-containing protein n=1 Tax=Bionectria ochroleuca TaxID=29856 RepID=A0A8H7KD55_BIOOC